ncbi:DUF6292 family protein [Amycolatopsis sp. NBC_00438]|uniref:DUF6292 family protein n=1 Tax=Amycolatopsis sp. NBC_00438 TaxID=2903558 RepID=UPI002E24CF66
MIPLLTGIDREHGLLRGLTGYLTAVGAAVGVGDESCTLDVDVPVSAYIALDGRLTRYPGRDVALLWEERHGWSFGVETHSGEDLLVLAYLGVELVPEPPRVRGFVAAARSFGGPFAAPVPPDLRDGGGGLLSRLARYRRDSWTTGASFLHQVG